MRINIVYAADFKITAPMTPGIIKNIAPTWGSWKTWHHCHTDNVICHDLGKARELLQRAIQAVCNFYLPEKFHQELSRPVGVQWYQGDFTQDLQDLEDIIAMHLVADRSDLVLLFGFDLANPGMIEDRFEKHRVTNRLGLLRHTIVANENTQWVLVNHTQPVDKAFEPIANLTCDNLENVLQLLG